MMKELAMATLVAGGVCTASAGDAALPLTREWDKIFPKSGKVEHSKATFRNRFGITLAADVYKPKAANGKLPAIAVSGRRSASPWDRLANLGGLFLAPRWRFRLAGRQAVLPR